MSRKRIWIAAALALMLLPGCAIRTLDQLYQVPKRSDEFNNLQAAIDQNLGSREYCAPLSGDNLQAVQMADLDGDGVQEYLLFTRGDTEKPLQILIFKLQAGEYILSDTIESYGADFDVVQYAQFDDRPGYELIVGCQISQQISRSVNVYSLVDGQAQPLLSANYTKFLSCDFNSDHRSELMVLRPGESDEANGLAELYLYQNGTVERSRQLPLSESAQRLKRVESGKLESGEPAVYVDSAVGDIAVVTDVFTMVGGEFVNVIGGDISTVREAYVYAEDIDSDGVVELPAVVTMRPLYGPGSSSMQRLIRWYAVDAAGVCSVKQHTFHNFYAGWYMELNSQWAERVTVVLQGNAYIFSVWNEDFTSAEGVFTVYAITGTDRKEQAQADGRFALGEDDTVFYAAYLDENAEKYHLTKEAIIDQFHLIHQDWKTEEVSK